MNRKNKLLGIILILSLIFICACDYDPYDGQRPDDYPYSQWVCEEYNISFSVGEKYELLDAVMEIDGETIPFEFAWFMYGNTLNINFDIDGEFQYLEGSGSFGEEAFSIYIADTKGYYPTEEVTLEFQRVDE